MIGMHAVCRFILVWTVIVWASAQVQGCATTSGVVATVKDCANQVTHAATLNVLGDVSSAVVCDQGSLEKLPACVLAGLAAVAKRAGWAAVDCALAEVQQNAADHVNNLPAGSSAEPAELLRWQRSTAAIAWRSGPDGGSGTAPAGAP